MNIDFLFVIHGQQSTAKNNNNVERTDLILPVSATKNFKDYSNWASSKLLNVLTLTYNFSASRRWKSMLRVSLI